MNTDEQARAVRRLPVVCRKLRTKNSFISPPDGAKDWREGSTTAVYWCLRTMETWGTDERLAHPHECGADRACFAAPDDAGVA